MGCLIKDELSVFKSVKLNHIEGECGGWGEYPLTKTYSLTFVSKLYIIPVHERYSCLHIAKVIVI